MKSLANRYATPLITGLFLVSLISGLALFLHIGPSGFHGMHEWLSLALILPFGLHLWKNWRPMTVYLRHAPMAVALAASVALSVPFLIPSGEGARVGPPAMQLGQRLLDATPAELAPALHAPAEALVGALQKNGFASAAADRSLRDTAAEAAVDGNAAIMAVLSATTPG